ncbi:hypothetical protein LJR030_004289 [Rhizobium sp. LjRoot30]|uniref:hypothetical protein n=1 Tax=Rhizobium sp. LjRoot30 TaxID=3342320 RepID=UPI003ED1660A
MKAGDRVEGAQSSTFRKPCGKQRVFNIGFRKVPSDLLPEWRHTEMIAQVPVDERQGVEIFFLTVSGLIERASVGADAVRIFP